LERGGHVDVNDLAAEVPFGRASKKATARQGPAPRLTAYLVKARLIKLGLRLDPRKVNITKLIIDHLEKVPL
jgi:uncharacterized protein (TIGR03435 family)